MNKKRESGLKAWVIVLIALIDDIAVLALVFLLLWAFDVDIPPYLIVIIGVVAGVLVFFIHRAIVPSLRRKQVSGREGMIGCIGEVIEGLNPRGVVKVKDEYWKAKSTGGDIAAGEEVEVINIDGLRLEVSRRE